MSVAPQVRFDLRWKAYLAVAGVALTMLAVGAVLVREVDRYAPNMHAVQTDLSPTCPGNLSPPGGPNSLSIMFGKASLNEQMMAARSSINKIIEGKLDQQTHDMFKQFPEYSQCRNCVQNCEEALKDSGELQLQECRRNCLRSCSEQARRIIDCGF